MNNKVKWIKLKGLLQGDLSVMNVHMPNSSKEHNFLWVELIQKFPKDYRWILQEIGTWLNQGITNLSVWSNNF